LPKDSKGNFHMNTQRAMAAEKMPAKPRALGAAMPKKPMPEMASHDAPDNLGQDGSGGDAANHLSQMHESMGGKHMHIHEGEDGKITTHHIGHDGMVQGPHEHPNMEAAKHHMGQVFDEGQQGHGGMTDDGSDGAY
jgi:hypothetical protein